ncbi:DUF6155 family protein [Maribacter confluentis]|uniref:DUF6155 family protein n=1 Tax=Maribacter confluentis TaxID=1656093 RepID=A0ABT8RUY0_9FLAO|nr:DUF6155 family protein [Maribacter confluentis]MDO1514731.1 DUF6155 family protein [Maribacter confluentis]
MSKRALKTYLSKMPKKALEEQILELYTKFPAVKTYYDFAFNPKEDKLIQEAKAKISNEYFPVRRKRPRARRSVAQKFIKHFIKLGVEPNLIADVMCYNLEIAQTFSLERNVADSFYKSMLNSFNEVIQFTVNQGVFPDFKTRIVKIYKETQQQRWPLEEDFSKALDIIE